MFQLLTQSTSSTTDKDQEMDTVDVTTKTELFGSGSDSNSDVDDPKITPKKKLKKLSSSEDEQDAGLKKTLNKLGRSQADVDTVKKKIGITKKMNQISKVKEIKKNKQTAERNLRRTSRVKHDSLSLDKNDIAPITPEKSGGLNHDSSRNSMKVSDNQEMTDSKLKARCSIDDSDEEKEQRFNKFTSIRNVSMKNSQKPSLLDNILSGQGKTFSKSERENDIKHKPPVENKTPTYAGENISYVAPNLGSVDQFKPPLTGKNVTYRLWHLYDKLNPHKSLRVLVRSKVAGVTKDGALVTPSVKLEHQSQFGAEQVSVSQCAKEWISSLIRPGSLATRFRITPDSQICMVEQKTLNQLTQESRVVGMDPSKQLVNLHNIFSDVRSLSPGQYILQHTDKSGAFCNVLEASSINNISCFDLHDLYSNFDASVTVPGKVQYQPIDTNILTPWHIVNNRVPGTFEPSGQRRGRGRGGRGRTRGRGRGKGWDKEPEKFITI